MQAKAWPEEAELTFVTEGLKFKETCADTREAAGIAKDPGWLIPQGSVQLEESGEV